MPADDDAAAADTRDADLGAAVQAAVDAAAAAPTLDLKAAFALSGSYYLDDATGETVVKFGAGWRELLRSDAEGGYDGIALYHAGSQSLVVVNRGTEGLRKLDDWMENIGAALFSAPGPQMDSAFQLLLGGYTTALAAELEVSQILITGHSLGGALADAQGALAASFFQSNNLTCPPVKVVGIASAGFAHAAEAYAATKGYVVTPDAEHFITHYIRAADAVPHHPGRSVFGTDQVVASVYEARREPPVNGKSPGFAQWVWVADLLREHECALYFAFYDQPGSSHIWYSHQDDDYAVKLGTQPTFTPSFTEPDDS